MYYNSYILILSNILIYMNINQEQDAINYKINKYKMRMLAPSSFDKMLHYIAKINYYTYQLGGDTRSYINNDHTTILQQSQIEMDKIYNEGNLYKNKLNDVFDHMNQWYIKIDNEIKDTLAYKYTDEEKKMMVLDKINENKNNGKKSDADEIYDDLIKNNHYHAYKYEKIKSVPKLLTLKNEMQDFINFSNLINNNVFISKLTKIQNDKSLKYICPKSNKTKSLCIIL